MGSIISSRFANSAIIPILSKQKAYSRPFPFSVSFTYVPRPTPIWTRKWARYRQASFRCGKHPPAINEHDQVNKTDHLLKSRNGLTSERKNFCHAYVKRPPTGVTFFAHCPKGRRKGYIKKRVLGLFLLAEEEQAGG